jgi:hypothetical protein
MAGSQDNELTRDEVVRIADGVLGRFGEESRVPDPVADIVSGVETRMQDEAEREAAQAKESEQERRRQEFHRLSDRSRESGSGDGESDGDGEEGES